jgi:hypothetical protein
MTGSMRIARGSASPPSAICSLGFLHPLRAGCHRCLFSGNSEKAANCTKPARIRRFTADGWPCGLKSAPRISIRACSLTRGFRCQQPQAQFMNAPHSAGLHPGAVGAPVYGLLRSGRLPLAGAGLASAAGAASVLPSGRVSPRRPRFSVRGAPVLSPG